MFDRSTLGRSTLHPEAEFLIITLLFEKNDKFFAKNCDHNIDPCLELILIVCRAASHKITVRVNRPLTMFGHFFVSVYVSADQIYFFYFIFKTRAGICSVVK
jgi:hypothetical protein